MGKNKEPTAKQVSERTGSISASQRGPIVVFTDEELAHIAELVKKSHSWRLWEQQDIVGKGILEKITGAQNRDPKFKEPLK